MAQIVCVQIEKTYRRFLVEVPDGMSMDEAEQHLHEWVCDDKECFDEDHGEYEWVLSPGERPPRDVNPCVRIDPVEGAVDIEGDSDEVH
jgi:hypothetical protein